MILNELPFDLWSRMCMLQLVVICRALIPASHCRASTISLVCKTWQRVEREHPHRPTELNLRPEDFTAAFLKWHCRDTSKLRAVRVSQDVQPLAVDSYRQRLPGLLRHLHAWAPSLRVLELVPPAAVQGKDGRCEGQGVLPLICTLSRLEGLALRQWSYSAEDVATFHCLTQLQNLQVSVHPIA